MPSTYVRIEENRIFRYNEKSDTKEAVSNFSIFLLGTVHVNSDGGGPGILMKIERYPDNMKE
jgi:hypothetical protein